MSHSGKKAAFDLLGISEDADEATIRKAWRALVRSYHPDLAKTDPQAANKRLAEINAAFDVLNKIEEEKKADAARKRASRAHIARRYVQTTQAEQRAQARAAAARRAKAQSHTRAEPEQPASKPDADTRQTPHDTQPATSRAIVPVAPVSTLSPDEMRALRKAQIAFAHIRDIIYASKPAYTRSKYA